MKLNTVSRLEALWSANTAKAVLDSPTGLANTSQRNTKGPSDPPPREPPREQLQQKNLPLLPPLLLIKLPLFERVKREQGIELEYEVELWRAKPSTDFTAEKSVDGPEERSSKP
jgi:hypothetical protein